MANGGGAGSAFGISVPEGRVEVLEAAAENLDHVARAADRTSREMRRAAKVDGWEGSASEALTHRIVQEAKPADIAEEQLPRAAKALMELADDLRQARRATKLALKQARAADDRRREAEDDANRAQRKAESSHAEAAALQGVIDGAATRGDPANDSREAQRDVKRTAAAADDAIADARRRVRKAEHDVEEAQRDGRVANDRYDNACQQAAKALRAVAAAAPHVTDGDDSGLQWKDVYGLLRTLWNGGPGERHLPLGQLATALFGLYKWGSFWRKSSKYAVWRVSNPAYFTRKVGRPPTFANRLWVRALKGPLSRLRGMSWLRDASRAAPILNKLGVAASALSTVTSANRLLQADPGKDPAGFVSDLARTGFHASTTAFLVAPNPISAGAMAVTGVVWAGSEVYQHWDEIEDFAGDVVDSGKDVIDGIGDGISSIGNAFGL